MHFTMLHSSVHISFLYTTEPNVIYQASKFFFFQPFQMKIKWLFLIIQYNLLTAQIQ